MGLGAAIGGWLAGAGVTAVVGGVAVATVVGHMIAGAIVGAAVGGLMAAVSGGDILEGVLFGAVGGAVAGGISGYLGAVGSTAASTGAETIATMGADGVVTSTTVGSDAASLAMAEAARDAGTLVSVTEAGTAGVAGATQSSFSQLGNELLGKAGESLLVGGKDLILAGMAEDQGLSFEEQAALAQQKIDSAERIAAMQAGAASGHAPNYSREVAEINARSAKEVAEQKSADLASQLAAQKEEREAGYLREDEARQAMRETAQGVLVSRRRATPVVPEEPAPEEPTEFIATPDTPEYKEAVA